MADRRPARPGQSARPEEGLRCRVRLADGRVFCGELPAWRHRALQLGMLHAESEGLVELTPGTRPPGGKVKINRRTDARHYLPGGAGGTDGRWLERLLEHAERIVSGEYAFERFDGGPREEAFVGVAPRTGPHGSKDAVAHTRFLWLDVDKPDRLPALWDFLAERPCQLLCESAGSGGVHCYWKLAEPLPAERLDERTGEAGRADRAGEPAADPRARLRPRRHPERRRPPMRQPRPRDAALWQPEPQARGVGADPRGGLRAGALPGRGAGRGPARPGLPRVRAQADRRARGRGPVPADPGGRVHGRRSPDSSPTAPGSCTAPTPRTRTATRRARSAGRARSCGAARRAGRPARSTTSRRWCSAGRGAAGGSATTRSGAPARTCSTSTAS